MVDMIEYCMYVISFMIVVLGNRQCESQEWRCLNGGTLELSAGEYSCVCPPRHSGLFCEVVKECDLKCQPNLPTWNPSCTCVSSKGVERRVNGECICHCFFNFTGRFCEHNPDCGETLCTIPKGRMRKGDCQCICDDFQYSGTICKTKYCPYQNAPQICSQKYNVENCNFIPHNPNVDAFCPYCGACKEEERISCEKDPECHQSDYGCVYRGKRPSFAACRTLGDNGADVPGMCNVTNNPKFDCDPTERCADVGEYHFALSYCPVMCGICPGTSTLTEPTILETTPTSVKINSFSSKGTSSLTKNGTTHETTPSSVTTSPPTSNVGLIAGVTVGAVLAILVIFLIVFFLMRKRRRKRDPNTDKTIDVNAEFLYSNSLYYEAKHQEKKTTTSPDYDLVADYFPNENNGYRLSKQDHSFTTPSGLDIIQGNGGERISKNIYDVIAENDLDVTTGYTNDVMLEHMHRVPADITNNVTANQYYNVTRDTTYRPNAILREKSNPIKYNHEGGHETRDMKNNNNNKNPYEIAVLGAFKV